MKRTLFLVSDHTGITVEALVEALLTQFDVVSLERVMCPFTDTREKLEAVQLQINNVAKMDGVPPLVFSSLVNREHRELLAGGAGICFDLFGQFLQPFGEALGVKPRQATGLAHGIGEQRQYDARVAAMNYTLAHDDGLKSRDLDRADVILVGVSRSGKTPTCLYLALHYGLRAANYPLTEEDFIRPGLPAALRPHLKHLFGLTIASERLYRIRGERRPDSKYASLTQCRRELNEAEELFQDNSIPMLDTTAASVEEIAASIVHRMKLGGASAPRH